jgi:hypothetical protein
MAPVAVEISKVNDKVSSLKQQVGEVPPIPKWQAPPLTKENCTYLYNTMYPADILVEWADLEELDLRLLDSTDPAVRTKLIAGAKKALTVDGFLFVTGTGVSSETLERNLAIAQHAISGISQEEKLPYAAQLDRGSYVGYKLRGIWQQQGGVSDNLEVGQTLHSEVLRSQGSTTTWSRIHSMMSSKNTLPDSSLIFPKSEHSHNIHTIMSSTEFSS